MNIWMLAALLAAKIALNTGGTWLLKHAALTSSAALAALGCGCYALAAALYVVLLQAQPLAVMAVVTSILGLVSVILIGILVFGETLTASQWIGIALAIAGMALTSLPR